MKAGTEIFKWLKLLGYTFKQGNADFLYKNAEKWKVTIPKYPEQGYILETDEYIVVNL